MDFSRQPRFHFSFALATFGSQTLPILMALHLWPDLHSGTAIFFHVDNEAALRSLVCMSCGNHAADQLVQHFLCLEQRMTCDA